MTDPGPCKHFINANGACRHHSSNHKMFSGIIIKEYCCVFDRDVSLLKGWGCMVTA